VVHPELRGVWIATIDNIDWPSRRDLTVEQQKAELIGIFDRAASLKLNEVFLQVRPMADAIYPAAGAPWSEYRAKHPTSASELAGDHLAARRPELVRAYGESLWLDPGDEQARDEVLAACPPRMTPAMTLAFRPIRT